MYDLDVQGIGLCGATFNTTIVNLFIVIFTVNPMLFCLFHLHFLQELLGDCHVDVPSCISVAKHLSRGCMSISVFCSLRLISRK